MGLSSNQARFLSLTSRQIDMEQRIQQICQRRLRLSSELENVATTYNNSISNRKMFTPSMAQLQSLNTQNLASLGYKVINASTKTEAARSMKPIAQMSESAATAAGYVTIHNVSELLSNLNAGTATAGKTYVLQGNIDLSSLGTQANSIITNAFQGTFDGNGYSISNMNINTSAANTDNIGFFSSLTSSAIVKNVGIENSNITATQSNSVGLLAGSNIGGSIDNCYSAGSLAGGTDGPVGADTSNPACRVGAGGLVGSNNTSGTIKNSYSEADVNGNICVGGLVGNNSNATITNSFSTGDVLSNGRFAGGLAGSDWGTSTIDQCYSSGNVKITAAGGGDAAGLVGNVNVSAASIISNSYSTGTVNNAGYNVGGLIAAGKNITVQNCYSTSSLTTAYGLSGGILARNDGGCSSTNTYYQNNQSSDSIGATNGIPSTGWNSTIWDSTTAPPTLKNTELQGSIPSDKLEEGLRNGAYSLAKEADEFTQDPLSIEGKKYEEVDWRTRPEIYDELYKGDDAAAENKYDKTIDEINSQDKKLQLEQTSIETEYKAVSSEREAVKKILDTNSTASFKYFS